jgi:hypothetical protein
MEWENQRGTPHGVGSLSLSLTRLASGSSKKAPALAHLFLFQRERENIIGPNVA